MNHYRLTVREASGDIVHRLAFNAPNDSAAERVQSDDWTRFAHSDRYRSKLYRRGERRPFITIG